MPSAYDYSLNNPNSRFQVLPFPGKHPAACAVCGHPNRPVIDFGANLETRTGFWVLYICVECISEASRAVELVSGQTADREREASSSLEKYAGDRNLRLIPNELYDLFEHVADRLGGSLPPVSFDEPVSEGNNDAHSGDSSDEQGDVRQFGLLEPDGSDEQYGDFESKPTFNLLEESDGISGSDDDGDESFGKLLGS